MKIPESFIQWLTHCHEVGTAHEIELIDMLAHDEDLDLEVGQIEWTAHRLIQAAEVCGWVVKQDDHYFPIWPGTLKAFLVSRTHAEDADEFILTQVLIEELDHDT